ncbi:pectinesterase inhibitor 7-like [Mangifera indica]|uniref:pectinesterase inhibitor 7-like n=1 Tax=Mangifera indica TaxID=29780 RepID=UPI001CF9BF13|nr:pectinesterase inhibitor 7-like [Mangifera indica]
MNKNTSRPLFLLLLFFLSFHSISALNLNPMPSVDFIPSPDSEPVNNGSDFIRSSCNSTLYPDLCYASLEGYSSSVQEDPALLARIAIGVSLKKTKAMAAHIANLSRVADYNSDPRASSALHDCQENFGDAVDEIHGSLKQMRQLGAAGGSKESLRFLMSNVQTWMSAALTDQETCTDGFDDVADGPVKADVVDRAAYVKKLTSNALALVNSFVDKEIS